MHVVFKIWLCKRYVQRPDSVFVFCSVFLPKLEEMDWVQFLTATQHELMSSEILL